MKASHPGSSATLEASYACSSTTLAPGKPGTPRTRCDRFAPFAFDRADVAACRHEARWVA
jgi:hypothetical protein